MAVAASRVGLFSWIFVLASCGLFSPETKEATELGKVLFAEAQHFGSLLAKEQQTFSSLQQWGGRIAGIGVDQQRDGNIGIGINNDLISTKLEYQRILKEIESVKLTTAPVQVAASQVTTFLRQRTDYLSNISSRLATATQRIQQQANWGFTHPSEVDELNRQLSSYSPHSDVIVSTLNDLRIKYKLADNDLK